MNKTAPIDIDTKVPLNVPKPTVTVGQLIEIVNFAYEEGILSYWEIEYLEPKKSELKINSFEHNYTYSFKIKDFSETDEGKIFEVNVDTVRLGIERLLMENSKVGNIIRDDIWENLKNNEIEAIDSDAVDCVIQAGLFGEIVYG
jgi:hypothetical protein